MVFKNCEGRRTVIPFHGSRTLSLGTIKAIMKDIGITEW